MGRRKKQGIKSKLLIAALLVISFSFYYLSEDFNLNEVSSITGGIIADINPNQAQGSMTTTMQSFGDIEVYFCPKDDCEIIFLETIGLAEESLHCALYDIGLPLLQDLLLEKYENENVDTKIVTDDHYYHKFDHEEFVVQDRSGHMHNKFCIIDSQIITTGSMNPTENGAYKNNNNLLIINSPELATNFQQEFDELYSGTFKKGDPVPNPSITLATTNQDTNQQEEIIIETYFCPDDNCADAIVEKIQDAQESIYFMTFSFTHDSIANNLLLKHQEGIDIQGVFEARQVSKYSKFELLEYQDIDVVKDGNKNNMHHKTFIIDEEIVITGSMNPSTNGDTRNDENMLIIHNPTIAKQFVEEFRSIQEEAKTAN